MKRVLNVQEQEALLSQPDPHFATELRNLVLLHFSLNNGLRMQKLLELAWAQIDVAEDHVLLTMPENELQERMVVQSDSLVPLLDEWEEQQAQECQKRTFDGSAPDEKPEKVFTDLDGHPVDRVYVSNMIAMYADCAGVQKSVLPDPLDSPGEHVWSHQRTRYGT